MAILARCHAIEKLSALGLTPWTGSSRKGLVAGRAGTEIELKLELMLLDFERVVDELAESLSELVGVKKQHQPRIVPPE